MIIRCVIKDCNSIMQAIHRWHKVVGGKVEFWSCPICNNEITVEEVKE